MKQRTKPPRRRRLKPPVLTVDEAFAIMNQAGYERFRTDLVECLKARRFSPRKAELIAWASNTPLTHLDRHPVARRFMREMLAARQASAAARRKAVR